STITRAAGSQHRERMSQWRSARQRVHPQRLEVVDACRTVTGVVTVVRGEPDGDSHFDLRPDPPFAALVNDYNISEQGGALVVEIVPADKPGCTVGQPPRPSIGTYD